ncbi:acyltransferase [Aliikangiella coralliicola]|uniref:Acyltransferase n=2 Tax=Aliikangiella coralliicola TaxID=2592383 RepID=A0A545UGR7_9GAMM|nr:acyltransferase [Aliikangiella coralliicola]
MFEKVISIGRSCYLESADRLAFHNGPIKLTSVKVNDRPAGKIKIGNNVVLQGTAIIAYQSVEIEDNVTFGPQVTIMDSSGHPVTGRGEPDEAERITAKPVIIKSGAWIGMNVIILKGVTIGKNAVVGAGSVVVSDVPDNCIVSGNPCKIVKFINQ